jgi:hypothetical protein
MPRGRRAAQAQRERAVAAYHEAGHAVVGPKLGAKVSRVSIDENSGVTRIKNLGRGERAILTNLAGPYAQKRHAPGSHWRSRSHTGFRSNSDFDIVVDLIFDMHGKGKVADCYWKYVEAYAEQLVEDHWPEIDAVAKALLQHGVIEGDNPVLRFLIRSADLSGVLAEWAGNPDITFAEGLRRLEARRQQLRPKTLHAAISRCVRFLDRHRHC